MSDLFSIKFNSDAVSFEVQGPDAAWVDQKVSLLRDLLKELPHKQQAATAPNKSAQAAKPTKKRTSKEPQTSPDLIDKWSDSTAVKLTSYVEARKEAFKGTTKEAAIVGTFLKDELNINEITPDDIGFIYRKLGWKTINHAAQLGNAATRDKFFDKNDGAYTLTHQGMVFGRDKSKGVS
jgi:hypothetical protein